MKKRYGEEEATGEEEEKGGESHTDHDELGHGWALTLVFQ